MSSPFMVKTNPHVDAFNIEICLSSGYRSCVELLNAGYNKSGINVIKPSQSQSDTLNVSCDQTSRGGGENTHAQTCLTDD